MLANNGINANGFRFLGGGAASTSVNCRERVGWSLANRVAFSKTTSFPVGYYENALKRPLSVGEIASTFRTFGTSTDTASIFGLGSVAASLNLSGLIITTGFLIQGVVKSGAAVGIATFAPLTLAGRGGIGATLNIGFKPSAFDIAQEVWGAIASLNNVIGTMGEVLNSATGGGGGGASASSIATAVWDRLLSGHTTTGTAGKALADAGGGSSPSTIASAVRTELSTELGRIDVASSTRASQSSVNSIPTTTLLSTDLRLDNLDTTISSRNATTPPTVDQIRAELDTNSTKLDVAVSTRLSGAGYTVPPTATQVATQVRVELGTELGRIDTGISTRLASTSYTAPPSASAIRSEIDTNSTKLDVAISTRLASVSYTIPPTALVIAGQVRTELNTELAKITAIPANPLLTTDNRLDNLDTAISTRLATSGYTAPISAATIANAVWTAVTRSLNVDVTISSAQVTAIAIGVEAAIINEDDSQQVIAAIVAAIGNTNITSGVIASAVRSELATELARIDVATSTRASQLSVNSIPTTTLLSSDSRLNNLDATISSRLASGAYTAPNNSGIAAILEDTDELQTNQGQWVTATGFATPTNISNAQTAIISEINANETKLDSIKAKTDVLVNTNLSGIEADLVIINEGVKKASLLVPHSEDL
jgi:hypothetical protein